MIKRGEHSIPDIIVIGEGAATHVIIKGMEFGNCISDFEYSARDKNGDLNPTVNLIGVCVDKFEPRDGRDTFERLKRMFEVKEAEAESNGSQAG